MMSRDAVRRVEQRIERRHAHGRLLAHTEFAPHTGLPDWAIFPAQTGHIFTISSRASQKHPVSIYYSLLIIYISFKYVNIYVYGYN